MTLFQYVKGETIAFCKILTELWNFKLKGSKVQEQLCDGVSRSMLIIILAFFLTKWKYFLIPICKLIAIIFFMTIVIFYEALKKSRVFLFHLIKLQINFDKEIRR